MVEQSAVLCGRSRVVTGMRESSPEACLGLAQFDDHEALAEKQGTIRDRAYSRRVAKALQQHDDDICVGVLDCLGCHIQDVEIDFISGTDDVVEADPDFAPPLSNREPQ